MTVFEGPDIRADRLDNLEQILNIFYLRHIANDNTLRVHERRAQHGQGLILVALSGYGTANLVAAFDMKF